MNDSASTASRVSRAPLGCNRPVVIHLTQEEREKLEQVSKQEARSLSSTGRLLILGGMESRCGEASQ